VLLTNEGLPPPPPARLSRTYCYPRLHEAVLRGPSEYPGATLVVNVEDGEVIPLKQRNPFLSGERTLQDGYRVVRHLIDRDLVVLCRQPSLQGSHTTGHRIKVATDAAKSLRLNPSLAPWLTIQFDGAEVKLHVPQSLGTPNFPFM